MFHVGLIYIKVEILFCFLNHLMYFCNRFVYAKFSNETNSDFHPLVFVPVADGSRS